MAAQIADISELLLQLNLTEDVNDRYRSLANECLKRAEASVRRYLKYNPARDTRTEFYPQSQPNYAAREMMWDANDSHAYVRAVSETSTSELQLTHLPVRSITSLWLDYDGRSGSKENAFPDSSLQVEGVQFWANYVMLDSSGQKVCMDGILRSEGLWPLQPGTVKITYVSGYSDAELHGVDDVIDASPILEAVLDEAVRRFLKVNSRTKRQLSGFLAGPVTSERLGDYSYSIDASVMSRLVGGGMDLLPETEHKLSEYVNYGMML